MVYSDKFLLNMVNLTQIDLATEEDKAYQIDYWAKLFTATSWEEMIMIAENNNAFSEAAQSIYEINADEKERLKCRARHDYYKMQNIRENKIREANAKIQEVTAERDALADENAKLRAKIAELEQKNS